MKPHHHHLLTLPIAAVLYLLMDDPSGKPAVVHSSMTGEATAAEALEPAATPVPEVSRGFEDVTVVTRVTMIRTEQRSLEQLCFDWINGK